MLIATECKWCGTDFEYDKQGKGRMRRYCSPKCKAQCRGRYWHQCKACGTEWESMHPNVNYCSTACGNKSPKRVAAYAMRTTNKKLMVCKHCGIEKLCRADRLIFCSRKCHFAYKTENAKPKQKATKPCEGGCGQLVDSQRKMCLACRALEKAYRRLEGLEYRCVDCGRWGHKATTQSYKKRCDECKQQHIHQIKRKQRTTPEGRAKARQYKRNREHKKREASAQCERFSDWRLFSRDRWKCQLCGRKVRKKQGETNFDDEATVDHIIPLSRGGKHAMANCQTACRACNTLKGATTVGQHRMF